MRLSERKLTGIFIFVLLAGCIVVLPNGIDLRLQSVTILMFALLAAMGLYSLFFVSAPAGLLILYAAFEAFRGINVVPFISILCFSGLFLALAETSPAWAPRKHLFYDCLIVIAGLNLLFQGMQYFHIYLLLSPFPYAEKALVGLQSNPDETFALYMMALPAFFRRGRWQLLVPAAAAGLLLASPLISSAQHYDAAAHILGRFHVWAKLARTAMVHPFIGFGFAHFQVEEGGVMFREAHNEFVEWLFRGGIAGACIGAAFLGSFFRSAWRSEDRTPFYGLIAACAAACAFFPWHITQLSLVTVFYLAIITSNNAPKGERLHPRAGSKEVTSA